VVLILAGFLGGTLVRLAPGFDVDERELDARFNQDTLQAFRRERAAERAPFHFYAHFLTGLVRGDLGTSLVLGRPVAELIRGRLPVTLRSVCQGLILGWAAGLLLAIQGVSVGRPAYHAALSGVSGLFLSTPSGLLALLCVLTGMPAATAIGAVIFPRVFPFAHEQFQSGQARHHVVAAHARGVRRSRVFFRHVLPAAAPSLLAMFGVSISMAFGAAIPVEVVTDSPGIGQLAWRAALGRDMSVLVSVTLLLAAITLLANLVSDIAILCLRARRP
jgi:ABC-type dipeptide/oligopeptide/nickel transport system permease component